MTQRRRDLLILFGLGVAVNGIVALLVRDPAYVDAAYYFNGGAAIASGRGLVEPYIWNYVGAPAYLPTPAFAYWQPLASLVSAAGIAALGWAMRPFGAAQAAFVLLAGLLPVLAYLLTAQIGERRHAMLAGLPMAFSGYYVAFWSLPETFTPFALAAGGALMLAGLGRRRGQAWVWLLAGLCAGLAHLARADGVLLVGIVALAALLPPRVSAPAQELADQVGPRLQRRLLFAALGALGYLVVMGPWFARNLAAFGRIQAPGGLSALWLVDYNDLFTYPSDLSAARFFAAGWGTILRTRWQALTGNLATFAGAQNLVFLLPFSVIGLWRRWRNDWLLPASLYGVALFGAMTLAFALPGVRGGWLHSGVALMPFLLGAAALGLDDAIRWVAHRRAGWRAREAWRVFGGASVLLAAAITVFVVLTRVVGLNDLSHIAWNSGGRLYAAIDTRFVELGVSPTARVMSNNPPGVYFHTGRGGVPIPNGDESMLLRAADQYGVTYLIIDQNVPAGLIGFSWTGRSRHASTCWARSATPIPQHIYMAFVRVEGISAARDAATDCSPPA